MTETPASGGAWRHLPLRGIVALILHSVVNFVRQNWAVAAGAGTGVWFSERIGLGELAWAAAVVLPVLVVGAFVYHRRFRYRLDADAFVMRHGLFEVRELRLPLERVQNVEIHRSLLLRILGLARVALESAGTTGTEVELPGIPLDEAQQMRAFVLARGQTDRTVDVPDPAREETASTAFEPGPVALFQHGLCSGQQWLILAFVGGVAGDYFGDWFGRGIDALRGWVEAIPAAAASPLVWIVVMGLLLAALAALMWLLSGLLSLVRFYGYRLDRGGMRLQAGFGLLETHERALSLGRVQAVSLHQTWIGRWMDLWHVVVHQTARADADPDQTAQRRFVIPGIPGGRLAEVLGMLDLPAVPEHALMGVSPHYRRYVLSRLGLLIAGMLLIAWAMGLEAFSGMFNGLAAVALLTMLVALQACRRWAWRVEGPRIWIRSGVFGRTLIVFDLYRCQYLRISASPYQRRHGLATLHFRLPHAEQPLPFLDRAVADRIANLTLAHMETVHHTAL